MNIPEEIRIQAELKETMKEMKGSAGRWSYMMADSLAGKGEPSTEFLAEMLLNVKHELPELVSAVMERTCNLQCSHCLYQKEDSSAHLSKSSHLMEKITHIVSQMPERSKEKGKEYNPQFMSAGRILRPEHLELFATLRQLRPDVKLGVIDNGTFVARLPKWPADFQFDWMDISIDGLEESHNVQRQSPKAFAQAIEGLKHARAVTKSPEAGGRISSLLTLTNINAHEISATANVLLTPDADGVSLVDEFRLTTVSPVNDIVGALEANADDFRVAWEQIKEVSHQYNTDDVQRVLLSIYRIEDMEKLAAAVGEKKFLEAFHLVEDQLSLLGVARNFVHLKFDGVEVRFLPLSIWTPEEFLIEADGVVRTAYEGQFTLEELRAGVAKDGRDTTPYTLEALTTETNFREAFERSVDKYWLNFGKQRLKQEMEVFARIQAKANQSQV